ncbi:MAG: choice-of-anchor D domain-containing protein, partial [Edaphobacter sp.]
AVDGSGALSVSPTSLSFSQLSVPQAITLANSSASAIAIQSISLSNQNFTESNTCGSSVAANASCTISVTATIANSDSATPLTATITIVAGDTIGVHTVPLSTSIAPVPGPLAVTPGSLTFTTAGVPQSVTLTNSGSAVLTLQSITLADPTFVQTNTCSSTLAPAASCTVSVTVNSLGATPLNSSLTVVANDAAVTHSIALSASAASGGASSPLSVSPLSSMVFPSTLPYFSSPVQTLTVTNTTPDAITFAISFTGAAANNYVATFPGRCLSPLLGGQSCTVQVAFTPITAGAHNGSLEFTLTSGASGASPVIIPVTGTGISGTGGAVTLSPASLSFTQFGVPAPVTVTNTGTIPVAIGTIAFSNSGTGSYSQTNNCGSSLDPQSVCTIQVAATALEQNYEVGGTLTLAAGDAVGTHSISLSTPAAPASISVPGPIAFGSWPAGVTSAGQAFYITQRPDQSFFYLQISGPDANDFSFAPDSAVSSESFSGCNFDCLPIIYFTPDGLGPRTATLTTTLGIATLTGTGSPAGPSFVLSGNSQNPIYQVYGTAPGIPPLSITVTNNGSTPLNLSETVTGSNASQYIISNPCPATLAVTTACTFNVTFAPDRFGSLPAVLNVTDSASGTNQTLNLMGFGTYPSPSASPNTIAFGDTQIGSVSGPMTTTLTAVEDHPVTISTANKNSEFGVTTTLCSATPCQIGITFAPTVTGVVADSVIVQDVVTGTSGTIYVRGTGGFPAVSLSPSTLSFATRNTGSNSIAQVVTLTNSGNAPLNISTISISGANPADFTQTSTCFNTPIDAGATCTLSISFSPSDVGNLSAAVQILSDAPPATIDLTGTATSPSP